MCLVSRFSGDMKIHFNFLIWIEFNFDLIGKKMKNQEGVFIVGPGKFDSIRLTKKSKNTYF